MGTAAVLAPEAAAAAATALAANAMGIPCKFLPDNTTRTKALTPFQS